MVLNMNRTLPKLVAYSLLSLSSVAAAAPPAARVSTDKDRSKVTVTIPAESPRSGQFRVAKVEGDLMTVSFHREEGGRDEAEMRLIGDDTLRWSIGQGREIVLVKARN